MKKNQFTHVIKLSLVALFIFLCNGVIAQNWLTTGNAGITGTNFLGTTDAGNLIFKANNLERGRLTASNGTWRFGSATNNAKIDSTGKLSFAGSGDYLVGGNRYAFRFSGDPDFGLFFNSTSSLYEFRDGGALPVFTINANTGAGVFKGTLQVGPYALPATDGTSGQVVKTNGAGILSFSNENTGWSLDGNAGTSFTNFMGTTDLQSLVFKTDNLEAMRLTTSQRLGVGTASPAAKLHINAPASEDAFRVQVNGLTKLWVTQNGGVSVGALITGPPSGLYVDSAIGIGISSPHAKLHIVGGSEANILTGGFFIMGDTAALNMVMDNNEIQVRNNSFANTLFLNPSNGLVSIGDDLDVDGDTISIGSAEKLTDAGTNAVGTNSNFIPLADNSRSLGNSTHRWLDVWAVDGTINTSDIRDKKNIRDLNYGLKELMQLHPVKFNWKDAVNNSDKVGLIAQELQKVIPEVVRDYEFKSDEATNKNEKVAAARLGVMYADLIPVLINAIQQQQKEIEELKSNQIKSQDVNTSGQNINSLSITLSSASLEQNIPNPLNNTTAIRYSIPANAKMAQLIITDNTGKTIKQVELTKTGAGIINIDATALYNGTYTYSLIVDGKNIGTKKMIIAR